MDKHDMYTIAMLPAKGKFRELPAPVSMSYHPKKKKGKTGIMGLFFKRGKKFLEETPVLK